MRGCGVYFEKQEEMGCFTIRATIGVLLRTAIGISPTECNGRTLP